MGKKKSKKGGDDYWDNEFAEDAELNSSVESLTVEDSSAVTGKDASVEEDSAPKPVSAEDFDEGGEGLMAMMKSASKKKKKKAAVPISNEEDDKPAPEVKIKSKKEKEKERKERQKQLKKEMEAKKNADVEVNEPIKSEEPQESAAVEEEEAKSAAGKKKGKKKGPPVAALREMLAAKQAAEEEQKRREEEAEKAEAERIRKIEEEEREKAEARRLKKEKEKERKEQLKREGKWVSDAERKKQQMAQAKLEAMRAAGMIVSGLDQKEEDVGEAPKKKKVVYDNRKKKKKQEQLEQEKEAERIRLEEEEKKAAVEAKDEGEDLADSWEDIAESWEDVEEVEQEVDELPSAPAEEDEEQDEDEDDEDDEEEGEDEPEDESGAKATRLEIARSKREERYQKALAEKSADNLRSPICVILGHVDTGKTKLLDKIRQTNVQEGEAGGITQQIGATYFPSESIEEKVRVVRDSGRYGGISEKSGFIQDMEFKVPGLLIIDTPGHESFTNLRSRGSSLCNIAVLVVDIMHGLEPQTIESINLLKSRKTPFIVALNKIDRIYGWKSTANNSFMDALADQNNNVKKEFKERLESTKLAFAEQGLNAEIFVKNRDVKRYVSLVPTSAVTGEGVPDLLMLLVQLTQNRLTESLMYLSELEATVLEVKVIEGHGTTIDVILSNGVIHEGDRIVVCGLNGPICTTIRALLTPQPMRELRVKSAYVHHKEIKAAMGVKIAAPDLEKAIAGSRMLVLGPEDDEEELMEEVMGDLTDLFESVETSGKGVCVQASTLGSLEALLSFLKDSKIPVSGINIGPVHKKDIMRASIMLESSKEFATILAFDVKIDKDAQELADSMGVRIFKAEIIYHLFDQFTAYMKEIKDQRRKELEPQAIWPFQAKVIAVFNKKDPILVGVDVTEGSIRIGTPVCVPTRGNLVIGKVAGIEKEHKAVEKASKGNQVAVRIEHNPNDVAKIAGRHFMENDDIVSKISRTSIDVLKEIFREDVSKDEWLLIKRLKPVLGID